MRSFAALLEPATPLHSLLEGIRLAELKSACGYLRGAEHVLEIGAGAGWQARALVGQGFQVSAIDVPESIYESNRVWPVIEFDGVNVPFGDATFDGVFSSNVLEHVVHLPALLVDSRRVMTCSGVAVHIVPSATWRIWTTAAHIPHLLVRSLRVLRSVVGLGQGFQANINHRVDQASPKPGYTLKSLVPRRHGERGNAMSETWLFSRWKWRKIFAASGWVVRKEAPNRLFYTGYGLLGGRLGLESRARLSRILGSSCRIYVLQPASSGVPSAPTADK